MGPLLLLVYVPGVHCLQVFPDTYVPGAQIAASARVKRLRISTAHASQPINESEDMSVKESEGAEEEYSQVPSLNPRRVR